MSRPKSLFVRVKTGYTRTRGLSTRTRPDPWHAYPTRTRPAGTGRVRVNPRVRVYPQTPSLGYISLDVLIIDVMMTGNALRTERFSVLPFSSTEFTSTINSIRVCTL